LVTRKAKGGIQITSTDAPVLIGISLEVDVFISTRNILTPVWVKPIGSYIRAVTGRIADGVTS
jgi:hypothetical protein